MRTRERGEHRERLIIDGFNRQLAFLKQRFALIIKRLFAGHFVNDRLALIAQNLIPDAEHLHALGNPVVVNVDTGIFLAQFHHFNGGRGFLVIVKVQLVAFVML